MSQHQAFYEAFHAAVLAFLVEDEPAIAALQPRFAQHAGTWTRAWACGYYRAAHLHPALGRCDAEFYDLKAPQLVQLIAPGTDTGPACSAGVQHIMAGFDATLAYDAVDGPLALEQINALAQGMAMLLIANPAFTRPQAREGMLRSLCSDVAEDVLGDWPR